MTSSTGVISTIPSRRDALLRVGGGFAGLALVDLLSRDGFSFAGAPVANARGSPLAVKRPHFPAKAKHVIFLFMNGAPSQVDTFDPKPELEKYDGKPYTGKTKVGSNGRAIGNLMRSPFEFKKHGKSGLPISSLFPHTSKFADDLCVVRSLYTDTAAHAWRLLADQHGHADYRQAEHGFVAQLRARHAER